MKVRGKIKMIYTVFILFLQATGFCRVYTPALGREVEVEEMLSSTHFVPLLQFY